MSRATYNNVGAVVLAAGKGTRLGCIDMPKVMLSIGGKPIVSYTVETLRRVRLEKKQICLVVGFCQQKVREYFGDTVSYAEQIEQRGTAHAAFIGMRALPPDIRQVLVLGGDDSAFYTPESLAKFIDAHVVSDCMVSLLTAKVENPEQMGRVVRHTDGEVEIIEKEYLTEEQKHIKEISTGTFCFNRKWFETMYPTMPQLRKLGEYGLPTALSIARQTQVSYQTVSLDRADEWFGINTMEELTEAKKRKGEKVVTVL